MICSRLPAEPHLDMCFLNMLVKKKKNEMCVCVYLVQMRFRQIRVLDETWCVSRLKHVSQKRECWTYNCFVCFEFILCVWCYFFVSCNSIFPVLLPLSSVDKGVGAFVM